MERLPQPWDYLIVTASNEAQGRAYESQLRLRRELGMLSQARHVLTVADPGGRRAGSGGSTLYCVEGVLEREAGRRGAGASAEEILRGLRILIVHAGGDSQRLPAYGPCGKIFIPLPGEDCSAPGPTLFDRLVSTLLDWPAPAACVGQVVVVSGDALVLFDAAAMPESGGTIALGSYVAAEEAQRHGVFCVNADGSLRLYLQKPSPEELARSGALDRRGRALLDLGLMSFDAAAMAALLHAFEPGSMKESVHALGVDLYREICCALGTEATEERYIASAIASGSSWKDSDLARLFPALHSIPMRVRALDRSTFLHFGATRQLAQSGIALLEHDGARPASARLAIRSEVQEGAGPSQSRAWIEGCRLRAPLRLDGGNVVTGVDACEEAALPPGACLDVSRGRSRSGEPVWFVRCYGEGDAFKDTVAGGARFCGMPLMEWLAATGARAEDVWSGGGPVESRSLWDARVFPAEPVAWRQTFARWLWMFDPASAGEADLRAWREADRYSSAEIALLADQDDFHSRRSALRAVELRGSLTSLFTRESSFSAEDLAHVLGHSEDRAGWVAAMLGEARSHREDSDSGHGLESFTYCRIVHSLGSAVERLAECGAPLEAVLPGLALRIPHEAAGWLVANGLAFDQRTDAADWSRRLRAAAFAELNRSVLRSAMKPRPRPRNALRADETIWGRAPARIELGGGWTDTPPYTLEYGGDVANAAVNLNGQPPIHCYCRVIEEPVVRLSSIDTGRRLTITELDELLDYRRPGDGFALAKAALAISGFSSEREGRLHEMLEEFGGGIELTTLVGIPKGSGLGTSSILGAVLIAVVERMMGRVLTKRELFHDVLRLEQALTTGGGWQDQIGGGVGGSKITSTQAGMFPDPRIHYVPDDVIDPKLNGGSTLLYYTGLTRLAKNILEQIVGGYFNRNRGIMRSLAHEHLVARAVAGAMARKDARRFGECVDAAWRLQKELCGEVTNDAIERLLERVRPHVHGMRISGAGSGGFLFMIAKSPGDAARIREMLDSEPLNERSRFFEFEINHAGLEVTTC